MDAAITLCKIILAKPNQTDQSNSLSSIIKKRTADYLLLTPNIIRGSAPHVRSVRHSQISDEHLPKSITVKIEDGYIRAALRLLLSDDALTEVNDVTFTKLQERHHHSDENRRNFPMLLHIKAFLQESEFEFKAPNSSFPTGFAGDPDGPQHVSDLLSCLEVGPTRLTKITTIFNRLLQGNCTSAVLPILFGRNLTAQNNKSGGIGPIAVDYYWRKQTVKCANTYVATKLTPLFLPIQLGVGVKGGYESAVHAFFNLLIQCLITM